MKRIATILSLSLAIILINSCGDSEIKDCVNGATGNFTGTNSCNEDPVTVELDGENSGDIVLNIIGSFGLQATVDENCNISIPFQTISFEDPETAEITEANYSGTGTHIDNTLTFTIEQDIVGSEIDDATCIFTLTK